MMTDRHLWALREMAAEFLNLCERGDPMDLDTATKVAMLGGALAGIVPELLDALEELQRERGEGGNA